MKQVFWKVYAVFFVVLLILSLATAFSTKGILWFEYAPRIAVITLATLGLCGFAWKKPIGRPWLWKAVFYFMIITLLWVGIVRLLDERSSLRQACSDTACFVVYNLSGIIFMGIFFWGLFRYAYRSPEIWKQNNFRELP